jgi:hypothetical protein
MDEMRDGSGDILVKEGDSSTQQERYASLIGWNSRTVYCNCSKAKLWAV